MVTPGSTLFPFTTLFRSCLPLLSVTVAVIVCVPVERVLVVSVPPVPSDPSRLEVQMMPGVRVPSSDRKSVAEGESGALGAGRVTGAGAVIVMRGVALTGIVIWAVYGRPVPAV